jgi:hypothetical protein
LLSGFPGFSTPKQRAGLRTRDVHKGKRKRLPEIQ